MGGLGTVTLTASTATPRWPWTLLVRSSNPVIACLASQYAGWRLIRRRKGKDAFFALGSGPARALARVEPLFDELAYRDHATDRHARPGEQPSAAHPRWSPRSPTTAGLRPDRLTLIYAPTQSLAGGVQVVARVLEVALHKAHELKFPLRTHGRRPRRGAALAAASGSGHGHGPHQ